MIDDMKLEQQKQEMSERLDARQKLEYLKQSEVVRLMLDGKYKPEELDSAYRNMKKRIREQEYTHQLDLSEIVTLRRQVELLMTEREKT